MTDASARVLLVEDDAAIRGAFTLLLEDCGYTVQTAGTGEEVRAAILGHLRAHRKWYAVRSELNNAAWNALTFLAILFAALASILTAVNEGAGPGEGVDRTLLIVLPALSALCGTLLVQFRLQEACRIRDQGRIAEMRQHARRSDRHSLRVVVHRAVDRGEVDIASVTAARLEVGRAMICQYFLFDVVPIADRLIMEIVDEVLLPLFHAGVPGS